MTSKVASSVYWRLLQYLKRNPDLVCTGQIKNHQRYCYATAPDLTLEIEGTLANGEEWDSDPQLGPLVDQVQEEMQEWCYDFNREMEKGLYAEMEYRQSEEALSEDWDANEIRFDRDGDMVDRVTQGGRRVRRGFRFSELSPQAKERALDKYRYWATEDSSWSEFMEEDYQKQLEYMGFEGVEIQYSLGYSQGDGASFEARRIDVRKFLEQMAANKKPTDVFNEAKKLAESLLEAGLAVLEGLSAL